MATQCSARGGTDPSRRGCAAPQDEASTAPPYKPPHDRAVDTRCARSYTPPKSAQSQCALWPVRHPLWDDAGGVLRSMWTSTGAFDVVCLVLRDGPTGLLRMRKHST